MIGVFIPGRLGSQRLPSKLVLPLGQSCLWRIACEKLDALPDEYGRYVLVEEGPLLDIAREYSHIIPIVRSERSANIDEPNSKIFENMKDVPEEYLMFLNPCLPFLKKETIIRALEEFEQSPARSMTSVKPFNNWLYKNGSLITEVNKKSWSTKDIHGYTQAAHCFHIFEKKLLFNEDRMLDEWHDTFQMEPEETTDVDTENDYRYVKYLWEGD